MKYLLPILFAAFLISCEGNKKETGFIKYDEENFSFDYPESWEVDTTGGGSSNVLIRVPNNDPKKWAENVNLLIATDVFDLQEFMYNSEKEVNTILENSSVEVSQINKDESGEYYETVYSGTVTKDVFKWKSRTWIHDNKAYILTYTSKQETYDKYLPEVDKILASFRLK